MLIMEAKPALAISILIMELVMPIPIVIKSKNKRLYSTLNKLHLPYSFKYEHSKFQYKAKSHRTARK